MKRIHVIICKGRGDVVARGAGTGAVAVPVDAMCSHKHRGRKRRGREERGMLLLQVAIVAACSLGQGVNNIFPTQLPSSCDVCNVQHRSANLKRHTAAAVAAANKLKY